MITAERGWRAVIGFIIVEMVAIVGAAAASRPNLRILLVKTSSLGDVVHNLPVVSDLRAHFPDAQIDWLVEEGFTAIPRLHSGVNTIIPVAVRRWRKHLFKRTTWQELCGLKRQLKQQPYDLVLDSQGLLKSALLTRWANGEHHGYSPDSIREPLAARAYDKHHSVSKALHAVERNRRLAAAAFDYPLSQILNYGVSVSPLAADWLPKTVAGAIAPYVVLLTASSRADKHWPDEDWITLGKALAARGISCLLPGGTPLEREHAEVLANTMNGLATPALGLEALAQLMAGAQCVIGVDTGLTHLAAALGRPTLAIFTATDPGLTGVLAPQSVVNLGGAGQAPNPHEVLQRCEDWLT